MYVCMKAVYREFGLGHQGCQVAKTEIVDASVSNKKSEFLYRKEM